VGRHEHGAYLLLAFNNLQTTWACCATPAAATTRSPRGCEPGGVVVRQVGAEHSQRLGGLFHAVPGINNRGGEHPHAKRPRRLRRRIRDNNPCSSYEHVAALQPQRRNFAEVIHLAPSNQGGGGGGRPRRHDPHLLAHGVTLPQRRQSARKPGRHVELDSDLISSSHSIPRTDHGVDPQDATSDGGGGMYENGGIEC